MNKATVWDANRRNKITGKIVQRGVAGLTIEDNHSVRLYVTNDRIIEEEKDEPEEKTSTD